VNRSATLRPTKGKIRQTLINLLGNAIKFTRRGEITLDVLFDQRNGGQLWLSVRIKGHGFRYCGRGTGEVVSSRLVKPRRA